jgi:hypothetical protein
MRTSKVDNRLKEIEHAVNEADRLVGLDPVLDSFLAGYLVTFATGVYEDCIETLFVERANLAGDHAVAAFVRSTLDASFRNPDCAKLIEFLKRFDPVLASNSKASASTKDREGLDSIVRNKNALAHVGTCLATVRDVRDFTSRALHILELLETLLIKKPSSPRRRSARGARPTSRPRRRSGAGTSAVTHPPKRP